MNKLLKLFGLVLFIQPPGVTANATEPAFTTEKITFHDRLGNFLVGNLYLPKDFSFDKKYSAIIVGQPFGAVKEQAANTYAEELAKRGYVTLTYDDAYSGESGGEPRQTVSPEANVEDVSAAVDYLGTRPFIDRNKIAALGLCSSAAFMLNAASIDPRIKAVVTASMYDIGRFLRSGLNDTISQEERLKILEAIGEQRWAEYEGAEPKINFGTPEVLPDDAPPILEEFFNFYRNPKRGFHHNYKGTRWTSDQALMNSFPFQLIQEISPRPILLIAGENAHSKYFTEDAYNRAAEPKELFIIKGANHTDLYDQKDKIPFEKIDTFFQEAFGK